MSDENNPSPIQRFSKTWGVWQGGEKDILEEVC